MAIIEHPQLDDPQRVSADTEFVGPPTPPPPAAIAAVGGQIATVTHAVLADQAEVKNEQTGVQKIGGPGIVKTERSIRARNRRVRAALRECMSKTGTFDTPIVSTAGPTSDYPPSAVTTPIPGSSERGGSSGNGNGNGNGDGPRRKKPGSGEHPAVLEDMEGMRAPTPDVLNAANLLAKRHGIRVETPILHDTTENQHEYRERLFGPNMWATIHELQQRPDLKSVEGIDVAKRVERYYALLAAADAYKAGEIPENNLGRMFGLKGEDLMYLFCNYDKTKDKVVRTTSVEFAPGNAEISRTLLDVRDKYVALAHIRHGIPERGAIRREVYENHYLNALSALSSPKKIDPNIVAVDIVQKFVDKARKKLIDGRKADICDTPEEFFEATGLKPGAADFLFMNLALDRIRDVHATLKLMKMLAKADGSTQFMFGFYAPFSPDTISFSKNENIPEFRCFDADQDLRQRWIGLERAETIYRIIADLNLYGFNTRRLAEHEYEVYSPHCIVEPASVLRRDPKYAFLKDHDFKDEQLNQRRDAVFSGELHDDELVGFPERENVILISGNVTLPEDGRAYEKIDWQDIRRQGRKSRFMVDPAHPKFAFLKGMDMGKNRYNRHRDRVFASGKADFLPFRENMPAARREYLKKINNGRDSGSGR
jgi:hypothetical protein